MPAQKPRTRKSSAKKKRPARSNSRVQKHRDKMRAAGLKPVQLWVYDTKNPAFIAQIKRECAAINRSADSHRVLDEMLSVADFTGWK